MNKLRNINIFHNKPSKSNNCAILYKFKNLLLRYLFTDYYIWFSSV